MYLFNRLCLWRQAWTKFYLLILSDNVDKRSKLPSKNGFWTSTYAIVKKTHDQTKPTRRWFYFIEWDEQTLNIWNASRQVKEVLFLSETYLIIPFWNIFNYSFHRFIIEVLSTCADERNTLPTFDKPWIQPHGSWFLLLWQRFATVDSD